MKGIVRTTDEAIGLLHGYTISWKSQRTESPVAYLTNTVSTTKHSACMCL
jgi:hypothetical protein